MTLSTTNLTKVRQTVDTTKLRSSYSIGTLKVFTCSNSNKKFLIQNHWASLLKCIYNLITVTNLKKWGPPSTVQIQIKCRNTLRQETWPSPKLIWAYKLKWTYQLDHGFVDSIVHANLINPKVVQMSKFDHDQNWFVCVDLIDSVYYFIVCIDSTKFGTCTKNSIEFVS